MRNKGVILFGIFGILVFIFLGVINFLNSNQQNNSNQEAVQEENVMSAQEEEGDTVPAQKEEIVKLDDKDIKERFKATEIVFNNLPESIEFWTEAYCPGSDASYDYQLDLTANSEYLLSSCELGEIGSYGGCKTCVMSKIKLIRWTCESDTQRYYNTDNGNKFVVTISPNCTSHYLKIFSKGVEQIIELDEEYEDISFEDYNFDGYSDLKIFFGPAGTGSGRLNESNKIYLFDENQSKYIYNKTVTGSIITIDRAKKEVIKGYVDIAKYIYTVDAAYKWVNDSFVLLRMTVAIESGDTSELCWRKVEYYANGKIVDESIEKGGCFERVLKEDSHLIN